MIINTKFPPFPSALKHPGLSRFEIQKNREKNTQKAVDRNFGNKN